MGVGVIDIVNPVNEQDLVALVSETGGAGAALEVCGRGTKRDIGRPMEVSQAVELSRLRGITLYEPGERVIRAQAGTPLKLIRDALGANDQELAFEPVDLGVLFGNKPWQGSIGSVFAANLSGARRISAGAARDHFLAVRAVNGRGEVIQSGCQTLKHVAGYDLCRGLAGSWGTLAIMSEVTMHVMPKAQEIRTVFLRGLEDTVAIEAMSTAMGTPFEVSGSVHLGPALISRLSDVGFSDGTPVTAIRLEALETTIDARATSLMTLLEPYGGAEQIEHEASEIFWSELQDLKFLSPTAKALWRLSTAPSDAPRLVSLISRTTDCLAAYDWSGGLVWLEIPELSDAAATEIRHVLSEIQGHATLLKAPQDLRAVVDVFQPPEPYVAALTKRLKQAFDPNGVLNPGRMFPGV